MTAIAAMASNNLVVFAQHGKTNNCDKQCDSTCKNTIHSKILQVLGKCRPDFKQAKSNLRWPPFSNLAQATTSLTGQRSQPIEAIRVIRMLAL
jgi:hypothetical protein